MQGEVGLGRGVLRGATPGWELSSQGMPGARALCANTQWYRTNRRARHPRAAAVVRGAAAAAAVVVAAPVVVKL